MSKPKRKVDHKLNHLIFTKMKKLMMILAVAIASIAMT